MVLQQVTLVRVEIPRRYTLFKFLFFFFLRDNNCNDMFPIILMLQASISSGIFRISSKRDLSNRVYASDEARAGAVEKAEKLEARLGPEHPTFIKPMLQSHVTGGFWLVSCLVLLAPNVFFFLLMHLCGFFSLVHE